MKPVIFGIKSDELSAEEKEFFLASKPMGFIIFTRNIRSGAQLTQLIMNLKSLFLERETLILIDQEGGRVQRYSAPHTVKYQAPASFIELMAKGEEAALSACYESNYNMALELARLGINVNCTPVADLRIEGAHNVIGDRSFGDDVAIVAKFCLKVLQAHKDAGIIPVVKHIPGHGRAKEDSHYKLPVIDTSLDILEETDFKVFSLFAGDAEFAMTAHAVYQAIDNMPATHSKATIDYIRNQIGFRGKIITDCLTMEALGGSFANRAIKSLEAGCDILLHCNGNMDQMIEIVEAISL